MQSIAQHIIDADIFALIAQVEMLGAKEVKHSRLLFHSKPSGLYYGVGLMAFAIQQAAVKDVKVISHNRPDSCTSYAVNSCTDETAKEMVWEAAFGTDPVKIITIEHALVNTYGQVKESTLPVGTRLLSKDEVIQVGDHWERLTDKHWVEVVKGNIIIGIKAGVFMQRFVRKEQQDQQPGNALDSSSSSDKVRHLWWDDVIRIDDFYKSEAARQRIADIPVDPTTPFVDKLKAHHDQNVFEKEAQNG